MATTTNYGWVTPDDTNLVKDGAAAIRTLGSSIDTTTKNLNPETTLGDIAYRSSTANTNTRLPIGTNGQILTVVGGVPAWSSESGDITEVQAGTGISVASATGPIPVVTNTVATTFDAKADLVVGTGADTFAKLSVGANDTVLTADSSTSTGLKWATPAASVPANAVNIIDTSETTTSTTFTDLATVGPTVTLTTGTRALIVITSYLHNSTNSTTNFIGFEVSGATTIAADSTRCLFLSNTSTGNARPELRYSWSYILTGLTAGSNTFTLKYRCSGGTLNAQNRILSVVNMGS